MAVTRIKAYHGVGSSISNSLNYIANNEKTDMGKWQERVDGSILNTGIMVTSAVNYAMNPQKTSIERDSVPIRNDNIGSSEELVSGYMCYPYMAVKQFEATMECYYQSHTERASEQTSKRLFRAKLDENNKPVLDENGEMIYDDKSPVWHDDKGKCRYQEYKKATKPRTAYMWVLSFPPERVCGYKIDPRICHQIGMEFIKQIDGGQYQAVVATHMDREHPHDHIVMCAYAKDGSHKYRDTKESLMKAREICDDLSLKFGLPSIPSHSQEKSQTISWAEWKARQEGQSWKEQMRQDINGAVRMANDFGQFLDLMKDSGYGIRETENHITYTMPGDDEFRCRDTKLGKDYEKTSLKERLANEKKPAIEKEDIREVDRLWESDSKRFKPVRIYVARYTFSGRRRSDLEMIFITAMEIIKALKDLFRDEKAAKAQPGNPVHQPHSWKFDQMYDSLKFVKDLGIESKDELKILIMQTGARLSVAKKEVEEIKLDQAYAEKLIELLDDAERGMIMAKSLRFDPSDLYITEPDKEKIRENLAKENPATPSQRRDLYLLLQKHSARYRLGCKYDQLNAREAGEVIRFLQNNNEKKPEILYEGRWRPQKRKAVSDDELQAKSHSNDVLFESHMWDYAPEQQQVLLNLRRTVQELADYGIGIKDYESEKLRIKEAIDHMDKCLKDVESLKMQYRNLKRLEYNLTLAETTAFTHGPAYERHGEELVEVVETTTEQIRDDQGQEQQHDKQIKRGAMVNPYAFTLADSFFDQTHTLG